MIVDLFGGPGGWSQGLRNLGLEDISLEITEDACATRSLNGFTTIRTDVAAYPVARFAGADGLIASPPCPDFSRGGLHLGRYGTTGHLTDLVLEWVEQIRPRWVACEQVPAVLPLWKEHAAHYETLGYSTRVGVLHCEQYGLAQTRTRAILVAKLNGVAELPATTHTFYTPNNVLSLLPKWRSAAEALGWDTEGLDVRIGFPRKDDRGDSPDGLRVRDWRPARLPSFTLTSKGRNWSVEVAGERSVTPPEYLDRVGGGNWEWCEQTSRWRRRFTIEEALTIQGFPEGFRLSGSRTSQFAQVGDAVPPVLAEHILRGLV